jgi:HSF-type DNA-binding
MATSAFQENMEPSPNTEAQNTGEELLAPSLASGSKRFPERLFELLNTEAAPRSLYWLPGGKAFAIEQETFAPEVLDRYFQATKFASFVRRLHKWYVSDIFFAKSL